jgi:hypothetical protein
LKFLKQSLLVDTEKNVHTVVVQEKTVVVHMAAVENVARMVEVHAKAENANHMVETEKVENANHTVVAKVAHTLAVENVVRLLAAAAENAQAKDLEIAHLLVVENVNHLTAKVEVVVEKDAHLINQVETDQHHLETEKEQNVEDVLQNNNNIPQITQILQIKFSEICEISGVK